MPQTAPQMCPKVPWLTGSLDENGRDGKKRNGGPNLQRGGLYGKMDVSIQISKIGIETRK